MNGLALTIIPQYEATGTVVMVGAVLNQNGLRDASDCILYQKGHVINSGVSTSISFQGAAKVLKESTQVKSLLPITIGPRRSRHHNARACRAAGPPG